MILDRLLNVVVMPSRMPWWLLPFWFCGVLPFVFAAILLVVFIVSPFAAVYDWLTKRR